MKYEIPCMILRGGTSKGAYLLEDDLPPAGPELDRLLLRLMGSPDLRQIDGLGGATSVTSKVAIVAPSVRPDADVEYLFAQVAVDKPMVSYAGNCGNILSGIGPFAVETGLVQTVSPVTKVRIFNRNTNKVIEAQIQTPDGAVRYSGDYRITGVPGTAAPIKLSFLNPAGSVFGALLPTGNAVDVLHTGTYGEVEVSLVDASNPLVFVRAADVGMTGMELPAEIDGNPALLQALEELRGEAAKLLGLVDDAQLSAVKSPGIPKLTIVAPASDYTTATGTTVHAGEIDLMCRMMSMQKTHPTCAMTGAMCIAAAAVIPGTIVAQTIGMNDGIQTLRIGHPGGMQEAGVDYATSEAGEVSVRASYGYRTARKLMSGTAFVELEEEEAADELG